jgi:hypothetical protein
MKAPWPTDEGISWAQGLGSLAAASRMAKMESPAGSVTWRMTFASEGEFRGPEADMLGFRKHGEEWIGVGRGISVVFCGNNTLQYQSVANLGKERRRFPCMLR